MSPETAHAFRRLALWLSPSFGLKIPSNSYLKINLGPENRLSADGRVHLFAQRRHRSGAMASAPRSGGRSGGGHLTHFTLIPLAGRRLAMGGQAQSAAISRTRPLLISSNNVTRSSPSSDPRRPGRCAASPLHGFRSAGRVPWRCRDRHRVPPASRRPRRGGGHG